MENLAYYNGKISTIEEMSIPLNDRAHFFGDGVYEFSLARNYKIYALDEHIDRFYRSAKAVKINIPFKKNELSQLLNQLVKKLDHSEQGVYWQVSRGTAIRSHTFEKGLIGNVWIMIRHMKMKNIFSDISAITLPDTRHYHCNVKTLNLLPSILCAQKAQESNAYEAILYRKNKIITECSHSNVHIIDKDGTFRTHPANNYILSGISRSHLIKACKYFGIKVSEEQFNLKELMTAGEILISSSSAPIMRCNNVNGKTVGGLFPDIVNLLRNYVMNDFIEHTK